MGKNIRYFNPEICLRQIIQTSLVSTLMPYPYGDPRWLLSPWHQWLQGLTCSIVATVNAAKTYPAENADVGLALAKLEVRTAAHNEWLHHLSDSNMLYNRIQSKNHVRGISDSLQSKLASPQLPSQDGGRASSCLGWWCNDTPLCLWLWKLVWRCYFAC